MTEKTETATKATKTVITTVTTVTRDKDGKKVFTPPGKVTMDAEAADALVDRGQAKTLDAAKAEADADAKEGVKVKTEGAGPKVKDK